MDGIAAIGDRITAIQRTLSALTPPATRTAPGVGGPAIGTAGGPAAPRPTAPSPSSADGFASVLAAAETPTTSAAGSMAGTGSVAGFGPTQRSNAAAIVAAGQAKGLSLRDQAIGVMTAMGESSLRVLDHGDRVGPDSRGLFQQRDNGAWGTLAQRMDPTASANSFFSALTRVGGRDTMAPTLVAHAVQRNADPQHYARHWDDAVALVSHLTGATAAQVAGR